MKKCIVVPDSFKGTLSSVDICNIATESITHFFPDCRVIAIPVADGGEGIVECFLKACGGTAVTAAATGPYGENIEAVYARIGDTAVIEMASAAGLPMVGDNKDPARASTFGVGNIIRHAVENGAKEILLGLGGSATNDGGCGAAAALGAVFLDTDGMEFVPTGGTLVNISSIDISGVSSFLDGVKLTAMCDIDNPMYGKTGAAYIFGPQKGADEDMVKALDEGLKHLDEVIKKSIGVSAADVPGAGAAGAFGAGCVAFFGAELKAGIDAVLDLVGFDDMLSNTDMVFTGEGRIDGQSLRGKVVIGVAARAKKQNVPVTAIVGDVMDDAYSAYDMGVTAIFSTNRQAIASSEAKKRSRQDYIRTMEDILRFCKALNGK